MSYSNSVKGWWYRNQTYSDVDSCYCCLGIKADPDADVVPRTVMIGGKVCPCMFVCLISPNGKVIKCFSKYGHSFFCETILHA